MTVAESLRAAAHSEDPHRACEVIESVVARLRAHDLDDADLVAASEGIVALATHRRWEVRRAVALALRHVRHGAVESTLEQLGADDAAHVQKAARESLQRREERAQLDLLPYLHDEQLERMLAGLPTAAARKAALRVGRAYTEFMIRGLYHEVVRTLTPANTSLTVLERTLESGLHREGTLDRVREFRTRLRHLRGIVNAARMYVTEAAPEYIEVTALSLVEHALAALNSHELVRTNGLVPRVEIDPGLRLWAEPTLLQQVFENVIKNGIEASEGDRPIHLLVTAKKVKQRIVFAITDYGCGMTAEAKREIYRPYRSKKRGGSGLGMPLVKQLVERDHGGAVHIEKTEPGVGTTISITLPIRAGA